MKTRPIIRSQIWVTPSILATLTLLSLLIALVADGVWDHSASGVLAGVLFYIIFKGFRSRKG